LKEKLDLAIRNVFGGTADITVMDVKSASQVPYYGTPPLTTPNTVRTVIHLQRGVSYVVI